MQMHFQCWICANNGCLSTCKIVLYLFIYFLMSNAHFIAFLPYKEKKKGREGVVYII